MIKPFDRDELRSRVKIGERIITLERRITQMANTDFLTGVLNRRAFMKRIEEEISRSTRERKDFSLVLSDIDHFKIINDTYGHQVGDRVLQKFTDELSEHSRPYDFVGRYGGEEFTVCLPYTSMEDAALIAERMRVNTENIRIIPSDNTLFPIQITASFGLASYRQTPDEGVDAIIKRADDALYKAKSEGRNCVRQSDDISSVKKDITL